MTVACKQRIHDAIEACRAIRAFTDGMTLEQYAGNLMLRSAVERQFEILGEALNKAAELDPDAVAGIPDLPRIVGMRNRIIHGYDSVDDEIIWDAIRQHVPSLMSALADIMA